MARHYTHSAFDFFNFKNPTLIEGVTHQSEIVLNKGYVIQDVLCQALYGGNRIMFVIPTNRTWGAIIFIWFSVCHDGALDLGAFDQWITNRWRTPLDAQYVLDDHVEQKNQYVTQFVNRFHAWTGMHPRRLNTWSSLEYPSQYLIWAPDEASNQETFFENHLDWDITLIGDQMIYDQHERNEEYLEFNKKWSVSNGGYLTGREAYLWGYDNTIQGFEEAPEPEEFQPFVGVVNGQKMLLLHDEVRLKDLSTDTQSCEFSDTVLSDGDWIPAGRANDDDTGWIMPYDGTMVLATGHAASIANNAEYMIDVYLDESVVGVLGTFPNMDNSEFVNIVLDIDFVQGQKIRVRARRYDGSGNLNDTTINVGVRWRSS